MAVPKLGRELLDPCGAEGGRRREVVRLACETDFAGWRKAARRLRACGIPPEAVLWTVDARAAPDGSSAAGEAAGFTVPRAFLEAAGRAVLHRSDERFDLLYRLLWRLQPSPRLMEQVADPEVAQLRVLAQDVDRAAHRMKAFARFHRVTDDEGEAWVAWFEPAHRVSQAVAPFFVRRRAGARTSILTPDICVHWDGRGFATAPGIDPADAPREDALEGFWRGRFAAAFGPDHRPRNPPPPAAIPERVTHAGGHPDPMVRQAPRDPDGRTLKAAVRASRDAPYDGQAPTSLAEVAAGVDVCRRCDLWRGATQGVAGEGPGRAKLLFVGEQPGDQEDLAGRPFVGPAGQMFDRALAAAGVPRAEAYVTNAVKHFKNEPRGKRRIHKTPDAGEVTACRWWLDAERRLIRPRVIVAMGATAAYAVMGKSTPIGKFRQQALQLPDQAQGVVTYHPSYLLRVPDAAAKKKAWEMFVADLQFAWKLAA